MAGDERVAGRFGSMVRLGLFSMLTSCGGGYLATPSLDSAGDVFSPGDADLAQDTGSGDGDEPVNSDTGSPPADAAEPALGDAALPPPTSQLGAFCDVGGVVAFEAESYAENTGFTEVAEPSASGSTVIQVGEDGGAVSFAIHLSNAGRWYIWLRTQAADSEDNGLILELDGTVLVAPPDHPLAGSNEIYLKKSATNWFWTPEYYGIAGLNHTGPVILDTTAGDHTFTISKRKRERPLIDKVVLSRDETTPLQLGPDATPCP